MSTNKPNGLGNLDDLFQGAVDDGLSEETLDLVIANLNGPTMMQTVGVGLDEIDSNEVTLVMNIIDASGSMSPHVAALSQAYNDDYLHAMRGSTAAADILVSTVLFNDQVSLLHGYVNLVDAPALTSKKYQPSGATALYDAVAGGLTNMVLYAQQLRQSGVMVRGLVLIFSDGDDNVSQQAAADVRRSVEELLRQEIYSLNYVGFVSRGSKAMGLTAKQQLAAAVQKQAGDLGIPNALVSGLDHQALRRIFQLASQSAIQVSQGRPATALAGALAP